MSQFAKNQSFKYLNTINKILHYLAKICQKSITIKRYKERKLVKYLNSNLVSYSLFLNLSLVNKYLISYA